METWIVMSIHLSTNFGLSSSDNCLLNINAILYRILHSESKNRVASNVPIVAMN